MPLSKEQKAAFREELAAERNQVIGKYTVRLFLITGALGFLGLQSAAFFMSQIAAMPFGFAADGGSAIGIEGTTGRQMQQIDNAFRNTGSMTLQQRQNSSLPPVNSD